jgi:propionyl-CoA synthetase
VVVSASAGIEGSRIVAYKPILDRAIGLARHKPDHCVIRQRPTAAAALTPGRTWPGTREAPGLPCCLETKIGPPGPWSQL